MPQKHGVALTEGSDHDANPQTQSVLLKVKLKL